MKSISWLLFLNFSIIIPRKYFQIITDLFALIFKSFTNNR